MDFRPWRTALILLSAILALKAIVLWQLQGHLLLKPSGVLDDAVYLRLAGRVAAGDWAVGPEVYYLSPFYIYFVGLVLKLSAGSVLAVRLVQILMGTAAVALMMAMAQRWFGKPAAIAAGVLAGLTGLFSFYEILILQSAVDPLLTALGLYLLMRAADGGSRRFAAAAGAAWGLLALNRPNVLPFLAVGALGLLWLDRWREGLVRAAAFAVAALVVIAPVTLRNRVVAGDWTLISSHGGLNFYIGNHEKADGTYTLLEGITPSIQGQVADAKAVAERAVGRPLKPSGVSDYFFGKAWAWIAAKPGAATSLLARKLSYVFNGADLALNYSYTYFSRDERTLLSLLVVGPWLLVPLGLVGLVVAAPGGRRFPPFVVWASFVPVYAAAVALFFVSTRYRLPLLVPLVVASGGSVAWFVSAARERRSRALATAGLALLVLGALANRDIGPDTGRANERTEMIVRSIAAGDVARAEGLLAITEGSHPQPGLVHFRAGLAWLDRGDLARAIPALQKSLAFDPAQPETEFYLGQAFVSAGRYAEAVPHLVAARDARVTPDLASFDLARAFAELGRADEARDALRRAVEATAADVAGPSWMTLGLMALRLDQPAYAEQLLRKAVGKSPDLSPAHENLGLALVLQGRAQEAIPSLERAVQLDPTAATARYNLAVALAQEGRLPEAQAQAAAALRIRPEYPQARAMLERLAREQ